MFDWEIIKKFFYRLYEKSFDEDIFSSAAQVGFYFMFALFPLLLFLISLFGLVLDTADNLRQELFVYLRQIMPYSAIELVDKTLIEVVENSSSGKVTLGFLIAWWSASAGIDGVTVALNAVYKIKETRPYWRRKLRSLILTLVIAVLIFVALGIIFYGAQFVSFLLSSISLPIPSEGFLKILSLLIIALVLILMFAVIYSFCPNHVPFTFNWITPGAIVAIVLWVAFSLIFRLYLQYFDSFAKTYGSVGAIIILMLWLYLTAFVILVGGAINAILNEFSRGKYEKLSQREIDKINRPNEIRDGVTENLDKHKTAETTGTAAEAKIESKKESEMPSKNSDYLNQPKKTSNSKYVVGSIAAAIVGIFFRRKK